MLIIVIGHCREHLIIGTPKRVWSTYFRYALNELEKDITHQSKTLLDAPDQKVIHEHAIPFRIVRDKLMDLKELTEESVSSLLAQYHVVAKISNEEHQKLKDAGLDSKMPDSWDGKNKFARYESVGIEIVCSKASDAKIFLRFSPGTFFCKTFINNCIKIP